MPGDEDMCLVLLYSFRELSKVKLHQKVLILLLFTVYSKTLTLCFMSTVTVQVGNVEQYDFGNRLIRSLYGRSGKSRIRAQTQLQ